jgi:RNA polymerase sigma-70 factor (sigma-E family)
MRRIEDPPEVRRLAVPATFDDLYVAEYRRMVRLAFVMLDEAGAAEEVVQDAFARVYERWAKLDQPGGYLRTCVVNGCRDVLRRRRVARFRPSPPAPADQAAPDHLLDALAVLSPARRAAVILRYYADLPEAEIADALGVRPGTVKSMLHRALLQLREVVER